MFCLVGAIQSRTNGFLETAIARVFLSKEKCREYLIYYQVRMTYMVDFAIDLTHPRVMISFAIDLPVLQFWGNALV